MTRRSHKAMADIMAGIAWSKREWLRDHGPKRSEMDRLQRQTEAEACEQAASDYRKAATRVGDENTSTAHHQG